MRTPSCPRCGNTSFEMGEMAIANANYRHHAIVCSSCGCIVGIEEYKSIMQMLNKISEKLGISS